MDFDASIWGPHYWFFLFTIALSYPMIPNSVTKRKYYDLITNFPLFIPDTSMGDKFSQLIDKYPVTPYLDNRDSFVRWVNFIHNKINVMIGKEEITLLEALDRYRYQYTYRNEITCKPFFTKPRIFFGVTIIFLIIFIYLFYH
jgi:hypothetical protein